MKIVEPYARIIDVPDRDAGVQLLRFCEAAARVSHRSEDAQTFNSWERLLRFVVMQHGDFSVIEHRSVSVEAVVDRGISHEWVRHRIAAYTQESTRFVNYRKKLIAGFIYPRPQDVKNHPAWMRAISVAEESYQELIKDGWKPQEARSVWPHALATKIVATYNLRTWRHFFLMRTSVETHPQLRQVTVPLLREFQEKIPVLYEDIEPNKKQSENMRRLR